MRIIAVQWQTFGSNTSLSQSRRKLRNKVLHCLTYKKNGSVVEWKKAATWQLLWDSELKMELFLLAKKCLTPSTSGPQSRAKK